MKRLVEQRQIQGNAARSSLLRSGRLFAAIGRALYKSTFTPAMTVARGMGKPALTS